MSKSAARFTPVPITVIDDSTLSGTDLSVFMLIARYMTNGSRESRVSQESIADRLNLTTRTVRRSVSQLVKRGHLQAKRHWDAEQMRTRNRYTIPERQDMEVPLVPEKPRKLLKKRQDMDVLLDREDMSVRSVATGRTDRTDREDTRDLRSRQSPSTQKKVLDGSKKILTRVRTQEPKKVEALRKKVVAPKVRKSTPARPKVLSEKYVPTFSVPKKTKSLLKKDDVSSVVKSIIQKRQGRPVSRNTVVVEVRDILGNSIARETVDHALVQLTSSDLIKNDGICNYSWKGSK